MALLRAVQLLHIFENMCYVLVYQTWLLLYLCYSQREDCSIFGPAHTFHNLAGKNRGEVIAAQTSAWDSSPSTYTESCATTSSLLLHYSSQAYNEDACASSYCIASVCSPLGAAGDQVVLWVGLPPTPLWGSTIRLSPLTWTDHYLTLQP